MHSRRRESPKFDLRPDMIAPEVLGMHVRSGHWLHIPAIARPRVREEITFWSGVISLATSVVTLVILLGR